MNDNQSNSADNINTNYSDIHITINNRGNNTENNNMDSSENQSPDKSSTINSIVHDNNTTNSNNSNNNSNNSNNNKSRYGRCAECNKKLKMINFTCKCNLKFCINHKNPHSHNCQYDNKNNNKLNLIKSNPKIVHSKFIQI